VKTLLLTQVGSLMPRLPKKWRNENGDNDKGFDLHLISKSLGSNGLTHLRSTIPDLLRFSGRRVHAKNPPAAHNISLYTFIALKPTVQHHTHNLRASRDNELENILFTNTAYILHI